MCPTPASPPQGRGSSLFFLAAALLAVGAPGCGPGPTSPDNAIVVGALLPFTGGESAQGSNIERALIQLADEVNEAGGIDGRPIVIDARDTHSDPDRGLAAAKALFEEGVAGLIGPQDGALARQLLPLLAQKQIVTLSGGLGLPPFESYSGGGYFFRISPSVGDFANVTATQMSMDGIQRFAVVTLEDDFDQTFGVLTAQQLGNLGGQQVASRTLSSTDHTFESVISDVSRMSPDAIVLAAPADVAAAFVQSWVAAQKPIRFYAPPPLKTDVFVKNTPPGALEGTIGVAPTVAADAADWARTFAARWGGDLPSPEAHYARDALALFVLAAQSAAHDTGAVSGADVRDRVAAVSYTADAEVVGWQDMRHALELLRAGAPVNYRGASGEVDIRNGFIVPGLIGVWSISANQIIDVGALPSTYCLTFSC